MVPLFNPTHQLESCNEHLQTRIRSLLGQKRNLKALLATNDTKWQQRLEMNEHRWMEKYDTHISALLQIIAHYEQTQQQLQVELEELRQSKSSLHLDAEIQTHPPDQRCITIQTDDWCDNQTEDKLHSLSACSTAFTDPLTLNVTSEAQDKHYVTSTIQKLIEQLQVSNQSSSSLVNSVPSTPCPTHSSQSSFRASILHRLQTPTTPIQITKPVSIEKTSIHPYHVLDQFLHDKNNSIQTSERIHSSPAA